MLKHVVAEEILTSIFSYIDAKNSNDVLKITIENSSLIPNSPGFTFGGKYYGNYNPRANCALHSSLTDEMCQLQKTIEITHLDKTLIMQNLRVLLQESQNLHTITNAIPPFLFKLSSSLVLSNFKPSEDYEKYHQERTIKQYHELLPKIKMYLVIKFIL